MSDPTAGERECVTCGHFGSLHIGIAGPCEACARGLRNRSHVSEYGEHLDCSRFAPATPDAGDASNVDTQPISGEGDPRAAE